MNVKVIRVIFLWSRWMNAACYYLRLTILKTGLSNYIPMTIVDSQVFCTCKSLELSRRFVPKAQRTWSDDVTTVLPSRCLRPRCLFSNKKTILRSISSICPSIGLLYSLTRIRYFYIIGLLLWFQQLPTYGLKPVKSCLWNVWTIAF